MLPPLTPCLKQGDDGSTRLLASNVGDARIVLCRGGKPLQLSEDHVPDRCARQGACLRGTGGVLVWDRGLCVCSGGCVVAYLS